MAEKVEERVSELERMMKNLAYAHMQTEITLNDFIKEMKDFKDEMKDFKDEMRVFKNGMTDFKDEMRDFKDEMTDFKNEMRIEGKRMNKQWGELANKMGTVVEDIVAPNIPRIAKEYFNCTDLDDFMIRRRIKNKKDKTKIKEFDIIAIYSNKVIINETKSTPRLDYIKDFIEDLKILFDYLPEYKGMEIIPIFSSLYLPDNIINYLTKNKIYAMAMKDDTMDILNPELKI